MLSLFLSMLLINASGMLLGAFLTENKRFALPQLSKHLDRKPFNCKPCLTFHFLWITYAVVAMILHSWVFFAIGLVFSLSIFGVLYLEGKSKISK